MTPTKSDTTDGQVFSLLSSVLPDRSHSSHVTATFFFVRSSLLTWVRNEGYDIIR
jgi:hypothetical protein